MQKYVLFTWPGCLMACNISEISSDRIAVMKRGTHMIWSLLSMAWHCSHQDGPEAYLQYMKPAGVSVFRTVNFSKGQDIEIYSQMAGNLHHDFILYLNTYSVLLTDQWLKLYVQGWEAGRGVLSATGSWQSYYSSVLD